MTSQLNLPKSLNHLLVRNRVDIPAFADQLQKLGLSNLLMPVPRHKLPAFRSIIKSLYPDVPIQRRTQLEAYLQPMFGAQLGRLDVTRPLHEQKMIIQDIAFTNKAAVEQLVKAFDQADPAAPNESRELQGKLTLRSRAFLPGSTTFDENPSQSVSDSVQDDLWSLPTAVPEQGINNSLYLSQRLNEIMNQQQPSQPRNIYWQQEMPWVMPWQWAGQLPVLPLIQDQYENQVQDMILEHLPGYVSVAIPTQFVEGAPLPGPYSYDVSQPLPEPGLLDALDFKGTYNTWRRPLSHEPAAPLPGGKEFLSLGAAYPDFLYA